VDSIGIPELVVLVLLVALLLPTVFFLRSLQIVLKRCAVESRTLSPGKVWLLLIPVFNLIWQFIVVNSVSDSLRNEFMRRGLSSVEPAPGKGLGMAMCVCILCSIIPILGVFAGIAGFICWILFWVKINEYSRRLLFPDAGAFAPNQPAPLG
jgi:hypothetical protein